MLSTNLLAYIDPMSGAVVLQLIVAFFAGALAFFRRSLWGAVRMIFRIKPTSEDTNS